MTIAHDREALERFESLDPATGEAVGVWPVDDDMAVAWCKYCKPDSIFTNRPKEVGAALRN